MRIDANRQVVHHNSLGIIRRVLNIRLFDFFVVSMYEIRQQEETLILMLKGQPMAVAANKMAEMEFAGGSVTG
ncbi:MAG: hypothetical protein R3E79_45090 [Caldilineaceae bacterium]